MIIPSCSVISHQSPCRQTPGNLSKYAALYLEPSGSFQKAIGMLTNGRVHTSSPCSLLTDSPRSLKTCTAIASARHCSSPRYTGAIGFPPAKHETMSVPPLMLERCTSDLIFE